MWMIRAALWGGVWCWRESAQQRVHQQTEQYSKTSNMNILQHMVKSL